MLTTMVPLRGALAEVGQPLVFASIGGAHLYGFASGDSDYDLRGAHLLPIEQVVGLTTGPETVERRFDRECLELDIVTHDLRKFLTLLLRRNGNALEQLHSPLVVVTTPEHEELRSLARSCVTRDNVHHYLAFADSEWRAVEEGRARQLKSALYLFRVLLAARHLMLTGEVESNLGALNGEAGIKLVADLMARKVAGTERSPLSPGEVMHVGSEYRHLRAAVEDAAERSPLPRKVAPAVKQALHEFLVRARTRGL